MLARAGGIDGLARARHDELTHVPGIGAARAAQVLAAVELGRRTLTRADRQRVQVTSPRAVAELLLPLYGNRPVEQFGVVLLDTKHRVMRTTVVSVGTLDASIVHPREVFREAAAAGAAAIVVFHNHPSGDPEPSEDDVDADAAADCGRRADGDRRARSRDSRQRPLLQHEGRAIHLNHGRGSRATDSTDQDGYG